MERPRESPKCDVIRKGHCSESDLSIAVWENASLSQITTALLNTTYKSEFNKYIKSPNTETKQNETIYYYTKLQIMPELNLYTNYQSWKCIKIGSLYRRPVSVSVYYLFAFSLVRTLKQYVQSVKYAARGSLPVSEWNSHRAFRSLYHSLVRSFFRSFICASFRSFADLCVRTFFDSFVQSIVPSFLRSLIRSFVRSPW